MNHPRSNWKNPEEERQRLIKECLRLEEKTGIEARKFYNVSNIRNCKPANIKQYWEYLIQQNATRGVDLANDLGLGEEEEDTSWWTFSQTSLKSFKVLPSVNAYSGKSLWYQNHYWIDDLQKKLQKQRIK